MNMDQLDLALKHIQKCARIPSFSSYEERLHPYVLQLAQTTSGVRSVDVAGNNLFLKVPGSDRRPPIALTAHLDKINHYGEDYPEELPVTVTDEYIEGAMDNTVGLGICLTLMQLSRTYDFPRLYLFLSEMEESYGLKHHPQLLKNNGKGRHHGMGAERLAHACINNATRPSEVITVDTTPLFKGERGVALYSKHWEYNEMEPSEQLIEKTRETVERFQEIDPEIVLANNTNDYLHYGKIFNQSDRYTVPSLALEPAIFPYHQKGERVFLSDIERVLKLLVTYLQNA